MPRWTLLAPVFVVSLLIWLLWAFPAAPLVQRADGLMLAGAPLNVSDVRGRIWNGQARWGWQQRRGELAWRVARQGWRPALAIALQSGEIRLSGQFSGGREHVDVRELDIRVPLITVTEGFEQGSASGWLEGRVDRLAWRRAGSVQAQGQFSYSGGEITWPPDGRAGVPALQARLFDEDNQARLLVDTADGQSLMEGRLTGEEAEIRVFRAWPRLLGVSQGGQDEDVVFQVTERLVPRGQDTR